eukprot:CAMPEP_0204629022 /NCGR_PEP_ID=MMETSP0717-20131115/17187_1 /ASSEMBLY_ACC=CAM_ASM_000666 /TAXON_ID=230516 /ORGANISM="Chaetoceros curvisetus" /LENGTH=66 /DNA_ID=CAMNT_0051645839 /DNA_START=95 /DNA_END=295 /DNA_ORIENTATION=+
MAEGMASLAAAAAVDMDGISILSMALAARGDRDNAITAAVDAAAATCLLVLLSLLVGKSNCANSSS